MSVLDAFNTAVVKAIEEKRLEEEKHGPVIEAGRKVAAVMDDPDWPMVRGKIDNVSPSVFLKYCDALGILPDANVNASMKKSDGNVVVPDISAFRSRSRVAKKATG